MDEKNIRTESKYDPLSENINTRYKTNKPIGPSGFGGWLILPLLAIIFTPIISTAYILGFFDFIFEGAGATLPQSFIESIESWTLTSKMMLFPFTIFTLFVAKLFFTKDYKLPQMYQYFLIANACLAIIEAGAYFMYFRSEWEQIFASIPGYPTDLFFKEMDSETYKDIFQALIGGGIWYAYFNKSIRVKNTFVRNQEPGIDL